MQFVCDTYNEDFSARKRGKSGNNQAVTICGIYRSYEQVIVFILFVEL